MTTPINSSGQSITSNSSGSCRAAVYFAGEDLGLPHLQFITFASHHFDQDGKLQFAAAHHFERIRAAGLFHANRHVGQQFLIETVAQIARCDELAFAAGERRVVDR